MKFRMIYRLVMLIISAWKVWKGWGDRNVPRPGIRLTDRDPWTITTNDSKISVSWYVTRAALLVDRYIVMTYVVMIIHSHESVYSVPWKTESLACGFVAEQTTA